MKIINHLMQQGVGDIFPSAVLLISNRKEILFHQAYGWLDIETPQHPTQKESLFDLASLTKIFTATAFLTLVEAKKVTLDTPLQAVFPELNGIRPIAESIDPLTKQICPPDAEDAKTLIDTSVVTFRHLLTHTSGLPPVFDFCKHVNPSALPKNFALPDNFIQNLKFAYRPSKKIIYSDIGFILLGEAVARLSAMSLWAYIQKIIPFKSLAINPGDAVPTEFCSWRKRRCMGEVHDENAACLGGFAGHAGLFATAKDVASLGQIYLNEGWLKGKRILSADAVRKATSPQITRDGNRRGLGWLLPDERGASPVGNSLSPTSYGHTGFTGTSLWIDPKRELIIALLTNRVYYGRNIEKIKAFRKEVHDAIINDVG